MGVLVCSDSSNHKCGDFPLCLRHNVRRGGRFRQVCLSLVAEVVRSLTDGVALGIQLLAECITLGVQISAQLVALVVTDLLVFGLVLELAALARLNFYVPLVDPPTTLGSLSLPILIPPLSCRCPCLDGRPRSLRTRCRP
jgi:hypothetical protein